jgi:hypothetical protein
MLSNILLILGVFTFTLALRSFHHPLLQKLGALGIFATSFLLGWLCTGSWPFGLCLAATWLFLPWLDLLTRIRKLSLPVERKLRHKTPPNSHNFPALGDLTEEVEGEGFEHVDDAGWDWEDYQQFYRLFYKPDERLQAAICLVEQHDAAFYYLIVSSRAKDGIIWTTWNYPFSYSLQLAPQWRVKRLRGDLTFLQLLESHRQHLQRNGIGLDQIEALEPERIQEEMQKDLYAQVVHNVATGVLTKDSEGGVRYSWRGLFYLWLQFLRDLVRFS